jgi:GNAT superfamily N-acetyltransferase
LQDPAPLLTLRLDANADATPGDTRRQHHGRLGPGPDRWIRDGRRQRSRTSLRSALHRGEGVADMLMADAERRIKDAGYSSAWLAVVAGNARARRFYERRGWSDRGLFEYAAAGDHSAIPVPSHRYVKDL